MINRLSRGGVIIAQDNQTSTSIITGLIGLLTSILAVLMQWMRSQNYEPTDIEQHLEEMSDDIDQLEERIEQLEEDDSFVSSELEEIPVYPK